MCIGFSAFSQAKQPVDYADPLIGSHNSGWTLFPGPSLPLGMVKLSPDNQELGWNAGYEYNLNSIAGFSHLHSWTMAGLLTMPATGPLKTEPGTEKHPEKGYRSHFRHETESASPGYYSVFLDDYGIKAELTTTMRTGFQRYNFPHADTARILVDLLIPSENGYEIFQAVITRVNDAEIEGFSYQQSLRKANFNEYTLYFVMRFSKPFRSFNGWVNEDVFSNVDSVTTGFSHKDIGAFLEFATGDNEVIMVQTGISLVSTDQARLNLETELGPYGWDFDAVRQNARNTWADLLGKIEVEGGTETDKTKFYTNLYRSYASMTTWNDVNGKYTDMLENVQQLPEHTPAVYGGYGSQTSFRDLNQLWTLVNPDIASDWVRSLLEIYDRGGWLPGSQEGIEYSGFAEASHQDAFIAGAYQKGIRDYDVEKAYGAVRKMQMEQGRPYEGGGYVGNRNLTSYIKLGYVPVEEGPVSNTLAYAYDDWTVAQMALALGRTVDYKDFTKRAFNYRNVFDTITGCICGKLADGTRAGDCSASGKNASPVSGNTENDFWQNFSVPQDPHGLIRLLGKDEFNKRLEDGLEKSDSCLFSSEQSGKITPEEIGMKPLIRDNQVIMRAAWLFNYSGKPWLTQKWIREIMEKCYGATPWDGWKGDNDQDQMSAWFVMSTMGLFQVNGGACVKPFYEIGSPLFEKIIIHLDKSYYPGEEFIIRARHVSPGNRYIQSARLNGKPLNKPWIYHEDLVKGGTLDIEMGPEPDRKWGSDPGNAPPSMSSLLSQDEIRDILAFDRYAAELDEWNRALKAYYYHRKEQFESLPNTPGEIIFLGNSITDQAEWHEMFNNLNVKNRGIGGDDTDGILGRLDEVVESKPARIFIMIGTNDLAGSKTIDYIISNYRKILDTIMVKSPATEIYVQSILPTNDAIHYTRKNTDIMEINRQLEGLAREKNLVYIDLYSSFVTPDNKLNPSYSIDGLHLNGAGYKLWVKLISGYVQ